MKCKECGQEVQPEAEVQKCPPHSYGPGYTDIADGVRTTLTQICRLCTHRLDTDLTKQPKEAKIKGPTIKGLSSGERFSR